MASGVSIEILDLRHFAASLLRPVLEAEGDLWMQRLHWDYHSSSRLLMQYLDNHMLPGYAALDAGHVTGYTFCIYEDSKAVIGDVFAAAGGGAAPSRQVEETLLHHLLETLLNSPQIDRIESQLLLHPEGAHAAIFRHNGFTVHPRLFMVKRLAGAAPALDATPGSGLELRPWRSGDLNAAARLICEAYSGHTDSLINDQYCTAHGSLRFLHNIVRYSGCGVFSGLASHVVEDHSTHQLAALVLGSRVSPLSGHITQLCVHPDYRRRGLGRMLLRLTSSQFLSQGVSEVSLTVTAANVEAVELYRSEGFGSAHTFDAAVWQRGIQP